MNPFRFASALQTSNSVGVNGTNFSPTLAIRVSGNKVNGPAAISLGTAAILRNATLTLAKSSPAAKGLVM
jgi:hypothetical protein